MNPKSIVKVVLSVIALIMAISFFNGAFGHNDNHNWQIVQYPNGTQKIISDGGWYVKYWGNTWEYPKYMQLDYSEEKSERSPNDDSVRVTFNDGGSAQFSSVIRIETPSSDAQRILFHQQLTASGKDYYAVRSSIKAHLINCLKATGPLMSASEHQTARKSEFTQVVEEQLNMGMFEFRRVERTLKDQFDAKGVPITIFATEVILDSQSKPKIAQKSPLTDLGITIKQFSVTGTTYDPQTIQQFSVKKEAFLAAENSKAQREQEVQRRLMVLEKGLREKAEIEAEANKTAAAAQIKAEQEKRVAELTAQQEKNVAETNSAKLVAVAVLTKQEAETKAAQELAVATLNRQAAEETAKQQIVLANARKDSLALGGAISERDRVLAEIAAERDVKVAEALAKVSVPSTIITGGSDGKGTNVQENLINLTLLKSMGVIGK